MFKTFTTAIAVSLIAASPAFAKTQAVSVTVDLAQFDLSNEAGLEALDKAFTARINRACGQADMKSRASVRAVRQCRASLSQKATLAIADITRNPERLASAQKITVSS